LRASTESLIVKTLLQGFAEVLSPASPALLSRKSRKATSVLKLNVQTRTDQG